MPEVFNTSRLPLGELSLSERAYYFVRESILRGDLRLGSPLSRRKLASQLGMSLVPVSEALQRLEREGLVESTPRVGTRVYLPTHQDILDRYVVREALESQSARLFSEKASAKERAELYRSAEHMDALFNRRTSAHDDPEFLYQVQIYHFQLHMRIAECSRCDALIRLIEQTHVLVFNWIWDLAARRPLVPARFHRDLVEVLAGTDPGKADAAMRSHIQYTLTSIVRSLEVSPRDVSPSDLSTSDLSTSDLSTSDVSTRDVSPTDVSPESLPTTNASPVDAPTLPVAK